MGKNVAVFVDVANIFYAAKAAGVDIDYVTLLKAATAGRDFVRAYAYTGLDPDNENQRNFHQFLARHQYKVVSKDIRKYGDGKVKANLDIELVVDMMKTARNLDIAVVVSGDGDFASAIRAVQEMGVRVEVISFRGNTSSDLIDVADLFTDITQIAKVDKGSTRSGRRVADDDEDLSMTEVPDKITEGTGRGRGRGRGGRGRDRDEVAASSRGGRPSRTPRYDAPRYDEVAAPPSGGYGGSGVSGGSGGQLIALPGERLSRAAAVAAPVADGEEPEELDETPAAGIGVAEGGEGAEGEAGRRRRRRRGGRGRGRGRQEGDVLVEGAEVLPGEEDEEAEAVEAVEGVEGEAPAAVAATERSPRPERPVRQDRPARRTASGDLPTPFDDMDALATSRARRPATPFGSVWDAQLGTPSRPAASGLTPLPAVEEDLDEPEIPEYLLAERRRGGQGQGQGQGGRGGRGGGGRGGARSAYNAAIERERYGVSRGMPSTGGGMSGGGRFAEPSRGGAGRGPQQPPRGGGRSDRPERVERAPRSGGGEPWSEVPPELEQMLLAQMQRSRSDAPGASPAKAQQAPAPKPGTAKAEPGIAEGPARRTTRRAAPAAASMPAVGPEVAQTPTAEAVGSAPVSEAPKRRPTRRPAAEAATAVAPTPAPAPEMPAVQAEAPKRRTTRKAAPVAEAPVQAPAAPAAPEASALAAAPKRRTTRKPAESTTATAAAAESAPAVEAPKRRTTTRKKAEPAEG